MAVAGVGRERGGGACIEDATVAVGRRPASARCATRFSRSAPCGMCANTGRKCAEQRVLDFGVEMSARAIAVTSWNREKDAASSTSRASRAVGGDEVGGVAAAGQGRDVHAQADVVRERAGAPAPRRRHPCHPSSTKTAVWRHPLKRSSRM